MQTSNSQSTCFMGTEIIDCAMHRGEENKRQGEKKNEKQPYLKDRGLNFGAGLGLLDVQENRVDVDLFLGVSLSPVKLGNDVIFDQRNRRTDHLTSHFYLRDVGA